MKKISLRVFSACVLLCVLVASFTSCKKEEAKKDATPETTHIDYVAQTKLDMDGPTQKQEVKWGARSHIDGDTSHFEVPRSFNSSGIVKARYLAVDTPESTGQLEQYGKAASRFTQEKLSNATSIMIESDGEAWEYDGNGRYLCWVWYKGEGDADYRCLNIELLQNGLGASSSASEGRYGEAAVAAIAQASREKLYMFSGKKDPEFPDKEATAVTLRELSPNVAEYKDVRVSVEGIVTYNSDYIAFIESYDPETDMYYGIQVFYGYNNQLISVLELGASVRVVGVVQEHYGDWQITDLKYNRMYPKDPANTAKLSSGNPSGYREVTAEEFVGNKTILVGEEEKTFKYAELAVATSLSMKNLQVVDAYTTTKEDSKDKGAMTLTCMVDGYTITVRTAVLKDADGNVITQDSYLGKTIDVKGVVEQYEGTYQIKVMTTESILVH